MERVADVNRAWAGDFNYIATAQGWLRLAVALVLKRLKVVGWSMANTLESSLVRDALEIAANQRLYQPAQERLLFHNDRGSQYAAQNCQQLLQQREIVASMSRKGNCFNNAVVERFVATLKEELVHREQYQNHQWEPARQENTEGGLPVPKLKSRWRQTALRSFSDELLLVAQLYEELRGALLAAQKSIQLRNRW